MTALMLAVSIPGLTDEDDPDAVADRIVAYLNEAGFAEKRISVSLWPFPQWFGVEAMDEMKALAAELRLRKWGDRAEHTANSDEANP